MYWYFFSQEKGGSPHTVLQLQYVLGHQGETTFRPLRGFIRNHFVSPTEIPTTTTVTEKPPTGTPPTGTPTFDIFINNPTNLYLQALSSFTGFPNPSNIHQTSGSAGNGVLLLFSRFSRFLHSGMVCPISQFKLYFFLAFLTLESRTPREWCLCGQPVFLIGRNYPHSQNIHFRHVYFIIYFLPFCLLY